MLQQRSNLPRPPPLSSALPLGGCALLPTVLCRAHPKLLALTLLSFPRLQASSGSQTMWKGGAIDLAWPPLFVHGYLPWQPHSSRSLRPCPSSRASEAPRACLVVIPPITGKQRPSDKFPKSTSWCLSTRDHLWTIQTGPTHRPLSPLFRQAMDNCPTALSTSSAMGTLPIAAGSPIGWSCHCRVFPGLRPSGASIVCPSTGPFQEASQLQEAFWEIRNTFSSLGIVLQIEMPSQLWEAFWGLRDAS